MTKENVLWTSLLGLACAGAMVVACGGGTPEAEAPQPAAEEESNAMPAATPEEEHEHGEGPEAIPHPLEGREACTSCHTLAGEPPKEGAENMPADHEGRADGMCSSCHKPAM